MSDIKLFRLSAGKATELQGDASDLEKPLQNLIEANLDTLLGIRFLASEYSTGKTHAGRIDSLGLDENNCPVILEYKRSVGENVINQGLFYLDWLMDHQAEFKLLVMDQLGKPAADAIDWGAPRLVCIAADFTKYDSHAVQQINRNIELIRYRRFGEELLLLELANATSANAVRSASAKSAKAQKAQVAEPVVAKPGSADRSFADWLPLLPPQRYLNSLVAGVRDALAAAINAVIEQRGGLALVDGQTAQVLPLPANGRDVSQQGHWGTGDLELALTSQADLDAAKPLILMAYEGRGAAAAPKLAPASGS